jgi:hypothetical protein
MVGNCAAKSSPAIGRKGLQIFYAFLLARFAGNPLIRVKSHDFLTKQQHNNHQQEGHRHYG